MPHTSSPAPSKGRAPGTDGPPASGCPVRPGPVDLVSPALYSDGDPHAHWRELRRRAPSWHPVEGRGGFWSAVRYRDAAEVLRDTATFTSERGTLVDLLGHDDPAGGRQIAVTDPPRHTEMRAPLQRALTAKAVDARREVIRALVREVIAPLSDGGTVDFAELMLLMPMAVSGTMMGVPRSDWPWMSRLTTVCIAADDPSFQDPDGREATLMRAHRELFSYFQDLTRHRRENPGDDLVSVLIGTRFEGRAMSPSEVVSNCYSLLLGANVTTPHSPNHVMAEHPGVLDEWAAHPGVLNTAVEEGLRWASPVNHFLRYATRDTDLGGSPVRAGDAVVVWLGSANRDEDAFEDPQRFDIRRKPNVHIAFGVGPHYCVGHNVARVTLRVMFAELLSRFTGFEPAGRPERLRSNFVSGYKHVPVRARPRCVPTPPVY